MSPLEHIWAGWRADYIGQATSGGLSGCVMCSIAQAPSEKEAYVIHKDEEVCVALNAFPYTSGHCMVFPLLHVPDLASLPARVLARLFETVRDTTIAVSRAYKPDGMNVGINLGRCAGAGVPDHVHVHVLPRWEGDTNFMTTVANARVLPEPLELSLDKLRAAWPSTGPKGGL
jgi:ATP adenylyltransferase